jgi:hypothetical protein
MVSVRAEGANGPWRSLPLSRPFTWILEHLYNHNPFYVLSAGLVLFGLHSIFQDRDALARPNALSLNSWFFLAVIAAYALVLAATGILIVRLGQVWDDARTILLTLVLLFVAMSVSFDKLVLTSGATLHRVLSTGLAFAVVLTEIVLRGLRIRLPALFRLPFYLVLGLFYLYPSLLFHILDGVSGKDSKQTFELTLWGIFLFPAAAGVTTLSLLPAVWKGPSYVAENGTPWRWPLFPWSLFVILAVAIVLRSYYFTVSFHPHPGRQSAFDIYFLVPFLLSMCMVLFEIGSSVQSSVIQGIALVAPLPLLWFTLPGTLHSGAYAQFLNLYMSRAGSPVMLTLWGLVALYGFAWLRGNRLGESGLAALFLLGSVVGPATVDVASLRFPAVAPLLAATAVLVWGALRRTTSSLRWFVASVAAIGTSTVALWDTSFVAFGAAPIHLVVATLLLLGSAFDDPFARWARWAGPIMLAGLSVGALAVTEFTGTIPVAVLIIYGILISVAAWFCWHDYRYRSNLVVAVFVTTLWLSRSVVFAGSGLSRFEHPEAAMMIIAGILSFLLAVSISLTKAGVWLRILRGHGQVSG